MLQLFSLSNNKLCLCTQGQNYTLAVLKIDGLLKSRCSNGHHNVIIIASSWQIWPLKFFKKTWTAAPGVYLSLPGRALHRLPMCVWVMEPVFSACKASGSLAPVAESSETGGVKLQDGVCFSVTEWLSPPSSPLRAFPPTALWLWQLHSRCFPTFIITWHHPIELRPLLRTPFDIVCLQDLLFHHFLTWNP